MLLSIDIETACTVASCPYHGKSMCKNDHSLSPWHSKITVIGVVGFDEKTGDITTRQVCRGPDMLKQLDAILGATDAGIIAHNAKFDMLHMLVKGVNIPMSRWVGCTQLMAYVSTKKVTDFYLSEYNDAREKLPNKGIHRPGSKHSLKTLAPYFLDVEPFWEVEHHDDDTYVLKDAEYTARLYPVLKANLEERGEWDFYVSKQLPWAKMLLAAEVRGTSIDMQALDKKEVELNKRAVELKAKLDEQWAFAHEAYSESLRLLLIEKYSAMAAKQGKALIDSPRHMKLLGAAQPKVARSIDYDSPKQMLILLKEILGYDCTSLEGDEGTGREILERLADEGKDDVKTYLEWRKTNKILTAFIPTYRELAHEGTLHPIFNASSTRTGRTSSERPNAQQIPPALRSMFKAREGYSFIGYDAAAIEAKLIAVYSEDPTLYEIISQGISLHDYNTKQFLGLDCDVSAVSTKYPMERSATKRCGFALFYNAGANRIRAAYAQSGIHLSLAECKKIHQRFKATYAPAYEFGNQVVEELESGGILMNLLGRPVKIDDPQECFMRGFNSLIQGSASDLNLEGARRAWETMQAEGMDAHPLLFVHDFVCFEVRDDQVEAADQIIKRCLTGFELETKNGPIELTIAGGVMKRWEK